MISLAEVERPIFLHFLDREATLAMDSARIEKEDVQILSTLVLSHIAGLSVNLHPLAIYLEGKPTLFNFTLKLNEHGVLHNTSSDPDIKIFLETRQKLYAVGPESHPIFFKDSESVLKFRIHKQNQFSMTDKIRGDVLYVSGRTLPSFAVGATLDDKKEFFLHIDKVKKIIFDNDSLAITTDNIVKASTPSTFDDAFVNAARKVLSALYYGHYCENNLTVKTSGLQRMNASPEDVEFFPHYDFPLLHRILSRLGFMGGQELVHLNEEILATYYSEEHCRFASSIHSFIGACYAQALNNLALRTVDLDKLHTLRVVTSNLALELLGSSFPVDHFSRLSVSERYSRCEEALYFSGNSGADKYPVFATAWKNSSAAYGYVPPVGFSRLERKLRAIRDELRELPDMPSGELSHAITILSVLLNFSGQLLADNLIDKIISEAEFQTKLQEAFRRDRQIGEILEVHPRVGGGITDLSIHGIRIELKSLSERRLTLVDCSKYLEQSASYGISSGKGISILCVLDCSKKKSPPFLAEDCVGIMYPDKKISQTPVIVVLMQANLAPPSAHSR